MKSEILKERKFENEFKFKTSRSGGPGGQNVNKVNTKVELRFKIVLSELLTDNEKNLLFEKLKNRINSDGELIIVSQSERSQVKNKKDVEDKFYFLVSKALTIPKTRKATIPTFSSKLNRLEDKKKHGSIKKTRKDTGGSEDN
jgi:ribosome-associated protein